MSKKNDWMAVALNTQDSPNVTFAALYANGITPANTSIQPKEYYTNIPRVKEAFTENGKFNEEKFNDFYDSAVRSYNAYANEDYMNEFINSFETSPYDLSILDNPSKPVMDTSAVITNYNDRNRHSYRGYRMGKAYFSDREVAQANYVRDENGNTLDWTPNDKGGLFKGLFRPNLVLDAYDHDGYYEENGQQIFHQKGELKLDEKGDPYYRKLAKGEDVYGKDVLHYTDTFTIEGTTLNKWDLLDSDGLETNVGKTVTKSLLQLGSYFIPTVGPILGGISALIDLSSALPVIGKAADSFVTGTDDNAFGRSATAIESWASRLKSSQSDEAKGKFFSLENIMDVLVTSAGQLYSQRVIGEKIPELIKTLKNTNKLNTKLGQQISLGYMAATSAADTYGAFKEAGASDRVAGLGMLATMGSFYGLMNVGYFKDKLFEGTLLDEDQGIRYAVTQGTLDAGKSVFGDDLGKVAWKEGSWLWNAEQSGTKVAKFISDASKKTVEWARKMPLGKAGGFENAFVSRAINEGIEETMEEVMQDGWKALALGAEALGMKVTDPQATNLDFGFSAQDILQRYATSFVGGALGGAVFEAYNQFDLLTKPELRELYNTPPFKRMVRDLMTGGDAAYDKWVNAIDRSKIGSRNLSAVPSITSTDPQTNRDKKFYGSGSETDNQRLALKNMMRAMLDNANYIVKNQELIFNSATLQAALLNDENIKKEAEKAGQTIEQYIKNNGIDTRLTALYDMGLLDSVRRNAVNLGNEVFQAELDLRAYTLSKPDAKQADLEQDSHYITLKKRKEDALKKYKKITEGDGVKQHIGYSMAMLDASPLRFFYDIYAKPNNNGEKTPITTVQNYAKEVLNIDYNALTDTESDRWVKNYVDKKFEEFYLNNVEKTWDMWEFYKTISTDLSKDIEELNNEAKDMRSDIFHGATVAGQIKSDETSLENINGLIEQSKELEQTEEVKALIEHLEAQKASFEEDLKYWNSFENPNTKVASIFNSEALKEVFGFDSLNPEKILSVEETKMGLDRLEMYYKYLAKNKVISVAPGDLLYHFLNTARIFTNPDITDELIKTIGSRASMRDFKNWIAKEVDAAPEFSNLTAEQKVEMVNRWLPESFISENPIYEGGNPIIDSNIAPEETDFIYRLEGGLESGDSFDDILNENLRDLDTTDLINRIKEIRTLLGSDIDAAFAKIEELKTLLSSINFESLLHSFPREIEVNGRIVDMDINPQNLDEFINILLGDFDNIIIPSLQRIKDIMGTLPKNITENFLNKLSVMLNGEENSIIKLIQDQMSIVESLEDVNQFELTEQAKKALKEAKAILNIFSAIVDGASSNFNAEYNKLADVILPIIDDNTAKILEQQISLLSDRIDYILTLGGVNLQKRFTYEKDVMKFDVVQRVKVFVEPGDKEPLVKTLEDILGIDFSEIWQGDFDISGTEEEQNEKLKAFEQARIAFQDRIYDAFHKGDTPEIVAEKIIDAFINFTSVQNGDAGKIDIDVAATELGMLKYLLDCGLIQSSYFYEKKYNPITAQEELQPTYAQSLIIYDAYAYAKNYTVFNKLLTKLQEINSTNPDSYISKMEALLNIYLVNGVPGAGKTEVISRIVKKMLAEDGLKFTAVSMTKPQVEKLAKALDITDVGAIKTWNDIASKCTPSYSELELDESSHLNFKDADKNWMPKEENTEPTVWFFDELPLLEEPKLIALSKYARANNIVIIGLGDLNQSSPTFSTKDNPENEVGMFNTIFNSSYRLTTAFRTTNAGKDDNTKLVYSAIELVQNKLYENRALELDQSIGSEKSANKLIEEQLGKITLSYTETPSAIYGDMKIENDSVNSYIQKLLSFNPENIAIIVNDQADKVKYQGISDKITVLTKKEAQGSEYDYIIVDASLISGSYLGAKEFYTMMSRARNATLFTARSLPEKLNLKFSKNPNAASILKAKNDAQKEVHKEFKEWWHNLYKDIKYNSITPEVAAAPEPAPTFVPPGNPFPVTVTDSTQKQIDESAQSDIREELNRRSGDAHNLVTGKVNLENWYERQKKAKTPLSILIDEELRRLRTDLGNTLATLDDAIESLNKNRKEEDKLKKIDYISWNWSRKDNDGDFDYFAHFIDTQIDSLPNLEDQKWLEMRKKEGVSKADIIKTVSRIVLEWTGSVTDLNKELFGKDLELEVPKFVAVSLKSEALLDGVDSASLVYYTVLHNGQLQAIPIGIFNGVRQGVYSVNMESGTDRTIKKEVDPVYFSSKGRIHAPLSAVARNKVTISDKVGIVTGWDTSPSGSEKFVENTKGKSMAMLSSKPTINVDAFLRPTQKGGDREFYTSGDPSIQLIGVQKTISTENAIKLITAINKLKYAETLSEEDEKKNVETIVQQPVHIGSREELRSDDGAKFLQDAANRRFVNAVVKTLLDEKLGDIGMLPTDTDSGVYLGIKLLDKLVSIKFKNTGRGSYIATVSIGTTVQKTVELNPQKAETTLRDLLNNILKEQVFDAYTEDALNSAFFEWGWLDTESGKPNRYSIISRIGWLYVKGNKDKTEARWNKFNKFVKQDPEINTNVYLDIKAAHSKVMQEFWAQANYNDAEMTADISYIYGAIYSFNAKGLPDNLDNYSELTGAPKQSVSSSWSIEGGKIIGTINGTHFTKAKVYEKYGDHNPIIVAFDNNGNVLGTITPEQDSTKSSYQNLSKFISDGPLELVAVEGNTIYLLNRDITMIVDASGNVVENINNPIVKSVLSEENKIAIGRISREFKNWGIKMPEFVQNRTKWVAAINKTIQDNWYLALISKLIPVYNNDLNYTLKNLTDAQRALVFIAEQENPEVIDKTKTKEEQEELKQIRRQNINKYIKNLNIEAIKNSKGFLVTLQENKREIKRWILYPLSGKDFLDFTENYDVLSNVGIKPDDIETLLSNASNQKSFRTVLAPLLSQYNEAEQKDALKDLTEKVNKMCNIEF